MPNAVGTSTGLLRYIAFSLFFYDYVLTFNDERVLIWRQKWTLAKILFLVVRYLTLVVIVVDTYFATASGIPTQICDHYTIVGALGAVLVVLAVQTILLLRIYVLYERRLAVLIVNGVLMLGEISITVYICLRDFPRTIALSSPDWVIGSCYNMHPRSMSEAFIAPLLFESYMAGLAVYKLVHEHRIARPLNEHNILSVLVRDSVVYFFLIAIAMAINVTIFALYPVVPGLASIGLVDAAGAIGGTRIILSMRNATFSASGGGGVGGSTTASHGGRIPNVHSGLVAGVSANVHFRAYYDEETGLPSIVGPDERDTHVPRRGRLTCSSDTMYDPT